MFSPSFNKISQVNLLTTVLNDAPVQPEDDDDNTALALKDSPQCVTFGLFMIWWGDSMILTLVAERTSKKLCNFLRKPVWHLLTRLLSEEANIGDRWSLANGSEWAIHEKLYKLQLQILAYCKSKRASLTVIFFSWVRIRKEIETGLCKS